jgi:hypothetical protein
MLDKIKVKLMIKIIEDNHLEIEIIYNLIGIINLNHQLNQKLN